MEEPIFFFGSSISFGLYYYFASIDINNQIGEMFFTKKMIWYGQSWIKMATMPVDGCLVEFCGY